MVWGYDADTTTAAIAPSDTTRVSCQRGKKKRGNNVSALAHLLYASAAKDFPLYKVSAEAQRKESALKHVSLCFHYSDFLSL
jgi:hypothetical protein